MADKAHVTRAIRRYIMLWKLFRRTKPAWIKVFIRQAKDRRLKSGKEVAGRWRWSAYLNGECVAVDDVYGSATQHECVASAKRVLSSGFRIDLRDADGNRLHA